MAVQLAIDVS